jgi:hypothetical protein
MNGGADANVAPAGLVDPRTGRLDCRRPRDGLVGKEVVHEYWQPEVARLTSNRRAAGPDRNVFGGQRQTAKFNKPTTVGPAEASTSAGSFFIPGPGRRVHGAGVEASPRSGITVGPTVKSAGKRSASAALPAACRDRTINSRRKLKHNLLRSRRC